MSWIQIKKNLINLTRVIEITITLKATKKGKSYLNFHQEDYNYIRVECDSDEEAITLMQQILLWIKPAVIECHK